MTWLGKVQNRDGSFGTGNYLPKPLETALVLGFVSASNPERGKPSGWMEQAAVYLIRLQGPDGSFQVPEFIDSQFTTRVCVAALSAYRSWRRADLKAGAVYVECFPPDLVRAYASSGAAKQMGWKAYLRGLTQSEGIAPPRGPDAGVQPDVPNLPRTDDWMEPLRDTFLALQRANGSWSHPSPGKDGLDRDRSILATASALRALRILDRKEGS